MIHVAAFILGTAMSLTMPTAVLDALRDASGGNAWTRLCALVADGRKTSSGLSGRYHEVDDLRTGYFKRQADYGVFRNGEGLNARGRWRKDSSGAVHALNSKEATAVAITEAYVTRRGYFRHDLTTRVVFSAPKAHDSSTFYRVDVTPAGGRTATLWIRKTHLSLDRITIALSANTEVIRFSDYRDVDGLQLPFRIAVDHGDELDSGIASIDAYRTSEKLRKDALDTPVLPADVTMTDHSEHAAVPAALDARSGFLIVFAKIDGRGPLPFILDTGGHDILTPAATTALGLNTIGNGKSYGAGGGTTPTRFTKVASIGIGAANVANQLFTVLYLDLGQANNARGQPVPIAGILGLEIFERFVVTIDYRRKTLILTRSRAGSRRTVNVYPMRFTSDMPLVEAALDKTSGIFGVDTANNAGLIVFARWLRANALSKSVRYGTSMSGESVGGSVSMRHARTDDFRLGPAVFRDIPIVISDARSGSLAAHAEAGNIGESVLSRFERITFDYRDGSMLFERGR